MQLIKAVSHQHVMPKHFPIFPCNVFLHGGMAARLANETL